MSHSLQVEVIPRPPAGEAPERSEGEGGGLSRMSKLAQKISCVTYFPESFVRSCGLRQLRYPGLASQRHVPIDSFSRFRGAGCGVREGGAAEAAPFFMGILHRRVERPNVSFPASRSYPASPCVGSSREAGVAGRSFLLAESDSLHSCAGNKKDYVSYVMTT